MQPLQPAWDDLISLSNRGTTYQVQIAALHTNIQIIVRQKQDGSQSNFTLASFQPYSPADIRPFITEEDFQLRSDCLVHLSPVDANSQDQDSETTTTDSICLFLYEVPSLLFQPCSSLITFAVSTDSDLSA